MDFSVNKEIILIFAQRKFDDRILQILSYLFVIRKFMNVLLSAFEIVRHCVRLKAEYAEAKTSHSIDRIYLSVINKCNPGFNVFLCDLFGTPRGFTEQ